MFGIFVHLPKYHIFLICWVLYVSLPYFLKRFFKQIMKKKRIIIFCVKIKRYIVMFMCFLHLQKYIRWLGEWEKLLLSTIMRNFLCTVKRRVWDRTRKRLMLRSSITIIDSHIYKFLTSSFIPIGEIQRGKIDMGINYYIVHSRIQTYVKLHCE